MSKSAITFAILAATILVPACGVGMYGVSTLNSAVASEEAAKAAWKDMMNVRDAGYQKITSMGGADKLAWEQYQSIFNGAIEGRYGDGGASALLLAIQESNPTPPIELRKQVMAVMEDSANDFKRSQTRMTDQQRAYATFVHQFPASLFTGMMGYPKPVGGEYAPPSDLDGDGFLTVLDYPVVVTGHTKQEFKTGEAEVINPYAK